MSFTDVGKEAKRKGALHPRHARKLDPEPPRTVSKAVPHAKIEKPYGFSYEYLFPRCAWKRHFEWYETERAASQALRTFAHKHGAQEWYRDLRAERRGAGQ